MFDWKEVLPDFGRALMMTSSFLMGKSLISVIRPRAPVKRGKKPGRPIPSKRSLSFAAIVCELEVITSYDSSQHPY